MRKKIPTIFVASGKWWGWRGRWSGCGVLGGGRRYSGRAK